MSFQSSTPSGGLGSAALVRHQNQNKNPFPWTLQRYILREMGKTFILAAAVLTGALGLGGSVQQMLELKQATPGQLLELMAFVLPVAAALTLPIAALFSAAATYGRLSADNEFIACRASGINLHLLFLPALALGVLSAAVTFVCMNFIIPRMVMNLMQIVGDNPVAWLEQRLHRPEGLKFENHRIYADSIDSDSDGNIYLNGVAFVEMERNEWTRYGTAQQIRLRLDRDQRRLSIAGTMTGLTLFDRKENQFSQVGQQEIAAPDVPFLLRHEIKFLTLGELIHFWRAPQTWPPVIDSLERLQLAIMRDAARQTILKSWNQDKAILLGPFLITGEKMVSPPGEDVVEISNATICERPSTSAGVLRCPGTPLANGHRHYQAQRVALEPVRGRTGEIRIEAFTVSATEGGRTVEAARQSLGPVTIPLPALQGEAAPDFESMLAEEPAGVASQGVEKRREEARNWLYGTYRRIVATMQERSAFTFSVLVLVILGAGLGIVFRGAHAATAFGISFIPSLLVIVLIVMGRQMAQNAGTFWLGLLMMWSGILAVGALDWYTLTRWVRR